MSDLIFFPDGNVPKIRCVSTPHLGELIWKITSQPRTKEVQARFDKGYKRFKDGYKRFRK